jgi:hypothetical protein
MAIAAPASASERSDLPPAADRCFELLYVMKAPSIDGAVLREPRGKPNNDALPSGVPAGLR